MQIPGAIHLPGLFQHAPHEQDKPLLEVRQVTVRYQAVDALARVSFSLRAGERVAVVGPNGAGKSTLFKVIAGLLDPTEGEVQVYGHRPVDHICIAYLPQRNVVDWEFPVSVRDVVMMGRVGALGLFRRPRAQDHQLVDECLELVRLGGLADRRINELSGGQQQRVFIARSLAMKAELMLMDEPFSGLDMQSQADILDIIDRLARERRVTAVVALHDLNIAAEHFDRALLLNHRLVGFGKPDDIFTQERLLDAYGSHAKPFKSRDGNLLVGDSCCDGRHHHG